MTIIDCQVHPYEANTPKRPWHHVPNWLPQVTGDEMVAEWTRLVCKNAGGRSSTRCLLPYCFRRDEAWKQDILHIWETWV